MVARIKRAGSLSRVLNYNEKKVQQGVAECIHAVHYPKDLEQLNFYNKLHRLEHLAALHPGIKANAVHISLNFDATDKLNKELLSKIADTYMRQIGFGDQPYLVYQHHDAGHPHIHIVTTNITSKGKRIDMQNIGRDKSEPARRAIEWAYGLVRAESRSRQKSNDLAEDYLRIVEYGKTENIKRAVTNVLDKVLNEYKFTSLPELNAALKWYNVMADRGETGSRMYNNKGLVYRVLDEKGEKIGTPIKASDFYSKPTLAKLERLFVKNRVLRHGFKQKLKTKLDIALFRSDGDFQEFTDLLWRESIEAVVHRNKEGRAYGITYVDHRNKCVFKASDLGREFTAAAFRKRQELEQRQARGIAISRQWKLRPAPAKEQVHDHFYVVVYTAVKIVQHVITTLLKPVPQQEDDVPYEWRMKPRRKRVRR